MAHMILGIGYHIAERDDVRNQWREYSVDFHFLIFLAKSWYNANSSNQKRISSRPLRSWCYFHDRLFDNKPLCIHFEPVKY